MWLLWQSQAFMINVTFPLLTCQTWAQKRKIRIIIKAIKLALFSFKPLYRYTTCIRPGEGFCCIEYQQCTGVANAFDLLFGAGAVMTDKGCNTDFIQITGNVKLHRISLTCCSLRVFALTGANSQCENTGVQMTSRICGDVLHTIPGLKVATPMPVCGKQWGRSSTMSILMIMQFSYDKYGEYNRIWWCDCTWLLLQ